MEGIRVLFRSLFGLLNDVRVPGFQGVAFGDGPVTFLKLYFAIFFILVLCSFVNRFINIGLNQDFSYQNSKIRNRNQNITVVRGTFDYRSRTWQGNSYKKKV